MWIIGDWIDGFSDGWVDSEASALRDCHHLGMTSNFSHERYMMFARVCTGKNGEKHICMRDKEAVNMYELFHVRNLIHQRACHHRVAKAVELMITDALIAAKDHFKLGEKNLTIYEAVEDLDTFTHLTDDILQEIERSTSEDLKQSQEIIKRIRDRDLYHYVDGELFKRNEVTSLKTAKEKKDLLEKWIKKITNQLTDPSPEEQLKKFLDKRTNQQAKLSPEDFRIVIIDLTYGMGESNPIDSLLFYNKNQPDESYKLDKATVSHMLPETFAETRVMLFYKGLPKKHVKTLWEKLMQPTGDVPNEPTGDVPAEPNGECFEEIYIDLTGNTITTTTTSQQIINMCENNNYQFFDDKTFKNTDLKHLTGAEMWKIKLSAWLEEVKENPDEKNPDLVLKDFLMVSYCFEDESNTKLTKVMLFYKGLSKIDVKEFWDLVKEKQTLGQKTEEQKEPTIKNIYCIKTMAERKPQGEQSTTKKEKAMYKVFNDSVHGHIEMHPLLVKIIDTPEFQRLRNIKQLGGGYYVYPGASHNRFEHSLGMAHLAGKLLQNLKKNLPEGLEITPNDELCVQIAALCHDLGHGPFSHAFDIFMKEFDSEWKHEDASVKMFERIIKENGIKEIMERENAFSKKDFTFITELIQGPNNSASEWPYKGRDKRKAFLYDIVANHRNGIDVDKMDYFARDCHHLGMKCNFSHERFMTFARVCEENGETQICMRDKEAMNMYELFHVRNLLHHNAYQHRDVKAVELMIIDALKEANGHLDLKERAFVDLTDDVLQTILHTEKTELEENQKIIKRLLKRDLYKFLGAKTFELQELKHLDSHEKWETVLKTWLGNIQATRKKDPVAQKLELKDFKEVQIEFNYGMKDKNPIDSLRFYRKYDPNTPIQLSKDEVSHLLPEKFAETKVMLFYKGEDKDVEELAKREIKHFWNDLDFFSSAIKNSRIYVDLTEIQAIQLLDKKMVTAQEICEVFSNQGFYRFIAEETFKPEELEHVDSTELQNMLEAWLGELEQQAGRQKIVHTAKDFKLVPYTPPKSKCCNLYVLYIGLHMEELIQFWQIVGLGTYLDYRFREFLCLYLIIAKEVTVRLLRQGYFLIDEKAMETAKLESLDDGEWRTRLKNWLKNIQKKAKHQQFRFTEDNFKVVSYHLPCQPEISKVMLFYKGLTEDDVKKLWKQVRKVREAPPAKKAKRS